MRARMPMKYLRNLPESELIPQLTAHAQERTLAMIHKAPAEAPRGKRRIHKKPNELEIAACHQWLERELRIMNPDIVVALGATAARAVFGRATAIGANRGRVIPADEAQTFTNTDVFVTVHPSYLLRAPDENRDAAYAQFVEDLKLLRRYAGKSAWPRDGSARPPPTRRR